MPLVYLQCTDALLLLVAGVPTKDRDLLLRSELLPAQCFNIADTCFHSKRCSITVQFKICAFIFSFAYLDVKLSKEMCV